MYLYIHLYISSQRYTRRRYKVRAKAVKTPVIYLITWNFREFRDSKKKKSQNLSDEKNKFREHNMTRKLLDTLGKIKKRISLGC